MENTSNTRIKKLTKQFENSADAYLIYGNSLNNSDLYYATKFKSEDPFFYLITKEKQELILVSSMEKQRAIEESSVLTIKTYSDYNFEEIVKRYGFKKSCIFILETIFNQYKLKTIGIPENFPSLFYFLLQKQNNGFNYTIIESPFRLNRSIKSKIEIKYIQQSINAAEVAMETAITEIKKSIIKKNILYNSEMEEIITGKSILHIISKKLIENNCYGFNTIISCGKDSEKPHGTTKGNLLPEAPIIIDIFPRNISTLYYGDMTRTILYGNATDELKHMYNTIKKAQEEGIKMIRPGISCKEIHGDVCDIIEENGYKTQKKDPKEGFIHSTGHGVGLDIHELPSIFNNETTLNEGNVITIEPGLYYKNIGGIRLEDTIAVTKNGYKNLNKYEKNFEINKQL